MNVLSDFVESRELRTQPEQDLDEGSWGKSRFRVGFMAQLMAPDAAVLRWALLCSALGHVLLEATVGIGPNAHLNLVARSHSADLPPLVAVAVQIPEQKVQDPPPKIVMPPDKPLEIPTDVAKSPEVIDDKKERQDKVEKKAKRAKRKKRPRRRRVAKRKPVSSPKAEPGAAQKAQQIQAPSRTDKPADPNALPAQNIAEAGPGPLGDTAEKGPVGDGGPADSGDSKVDADIDMKALLRAYLRKVSKTFHRDFDYPRAAKRLRLEGRAVVVATIDSRGRVLSVSLGSSSGHAVLDKAALKAVRAVAKVPPAPGALEWQRRAVRVPFRFSLQG